MAKILGGEETQTHLSSLSKLMTRQMTSMFISSLWDVKEPTHYSRRVGDEVPGVVVVLCVYMGGWV